MGNETCCLASERNSFCIDTRYTPNECNIEIQYVIVDSFLSSSVKPVTPHKLCFRLEVLSSKRSVLNFHIILADELQNHQIGLLVALRGLLRGIK